MHKKKVLTRARSQTITTQHNMNHILGTFLFGSSCTFRIASSTPTVLFIDSSPWVAYIFVHSDVDQIRCFAILKLKLKKTICSKGLFRSGFCSQLNSIPTLLTNVPRYSFGKVGNSRWNYHFHSQNRTQLARTKIRENRRYRHIFFSLHAQILMALIISLPKIILTILVRPLYFIFTNKNWAHSFYVHRWSSFAIFWHLQTKLN